MKSQESWEAMNMAGPLHNRGWVLQERELSPRVLHFTESQVLWKCRMLMATEGWLTNMSYGLQSAPRILDALGQPCKCNKFDLLHEKPVDFTARKVTKSEDMFPAFAGFVRVLGVSIDSGKYIAGLWENNFIQSLAWSSLSQQTPPKGRAAHSRHAIYVAPTWSWASVIGPTTFEERLGEFETPTLPSRGAASINSHHIELAGPDPYGRLKSAYLHISAPVVPAVLSYHSGPPFLSYKAHIIDTSSKHVLGKMIFDAPAESEGVKALSCVYLFSRRSRFLKEEECRIGLVLLPVDDEKKTFRRWTLFGTCI